MSLFEVKDRVPTKVLPNKAVRYGVYNEGGTLQRYEYMKREDEPTEEGTPVNKALIDNFQVRAIGYNELTKTSVEPLPNENPYKVGALKKGKGQVRASLKLPNGNIMLFSTTNSGYGYFNIYNVNGQMIKEVKFWTGSAQLGDIIPLLLKDGNVGIIYAQKGRYAGYSEYYHYVIYSQDGVLIKSDIEWDSVHNALGFSSAILLDNGNILLFVTNSKLEYYIFNPQGASVKGATVLVNAECRGVHCCMLKNGNILVTYIKGTDSVHSSSSELLIVNQNIAIVKNSTQFCPAGYYGPALFNILMPNGNVLTTRTGTDQYGYYWIISPTGTIVKNKTELPDVVRQMWFSRVDGVLMPNNYIMLVWGYAFAVYDENMNIIKEPTAVTGFRELSQYSRSIVNCYDNGNCLFSAEVKNSDDNYYTIVENEIKYTKDYQNDNLGTPLKNQIVNVIPRDVFAPNQFAGNTTKLKSVGLDNGNIFYAYNNGNKGVFKILNANGEVVKEETTFDASHNGLIDICKLTNGNVVIASYKGYFKIYSPSGNLVVNNVAYHTTTSPEFSVASYNNGNFAIMYQVGNNAYHSIYSGQGKIVVKGAVGIFGGFVRGKLVTTSNNELWALGYGGYLNTKKVLNTTVESQANIHNRFPVDYLNLIALSNTTFLSVYQNSAKKGAYAITNDSQSTPVKAETIFNNVETTYIQAVTLDNGNVLVVYQAGGKIKYVIINPAGAIAKAEAELYTANPTEISVSKNGTKIYVSFCANNKTELLIVNEDDLTSNKTFTGNSLNLIPVDTLLVADKYYELFYNGTKYLAKEVRV